jgi:hypothetical protein
MHVRIIQYPHAQTHIHKYRYVRTHYMFVDGLQAHNRWVIAALGRDGQQHAQHPHKAWEATPSSHAPVNSQHELLEYGCAPKREDYGGYGGGILGGLLAGDMEEEHDHVLSMRRHLKSADVPHTCFLPSIAAAHASAPKGHAIASGNLSEARQMARRQLEDTQLIFRAVSR